MDYYSGNSILLPNFMGSQGIDHKLVTICFSQAMEFGLIDGVLETEYYSVAFVVHLIPL